MGKPSLEKGLLLEKFKELVPAAERARVKWGRDIQAKDSYTIQYVKSGLKVDLVYSYASTKITVIYHPKETA